jgi:hypothetical protein
MTILTVTDVVAALDAFLDGRLDAARLEAWAERREMAEDVELAEPGRDAMTDALFLLSNPAINGPLTTARVLEVRAGLLRGGPDAAPTNIPRGKIGCEDRAQFEAALGQVADVEPEERDRR